MIIERGILILSLFSSSMNANQARDEIDQRITTTLNDGSRVLLVRNNNRRVTSRLNSLPPALSIAKNTTTPSKPGTTIAGRSAETAATTRRAKRNPESEFLSSVTDLSIRNYSKKLKISIRI